jgi:hypothetical protein
VSPESENGSTDQLKSVPLSAFGTPDARAKPRRFTPRFHIYVAAWRWENEVKFRWPRLSAQYHKAWAANSRCTVPLRLARPLSPVSVDPGKAGKSYASIERHLRIL